MWFKNWYRKGLNRLQARQLSRPRPPRRPQVRPLLLEQLEDRITPAILFDQGVSATVSNGNGPVLANPQVELVFWGSQWTSNPTLQANVTNAVTDLIGFSAYTDKLSQYGIGTGAVVGTATITSSSPGANFTDAQIQTMLQNNIGSSIPANSNWLYIVITQPGSTDPTDGLLGRHASISNSSGSFYYGWTENVGGTGALDDITTVFSHEYCEAVTDPDLSTGWQMNPRSGSNEICDGEAKNYTFRVDNYLVQSYFSKEDDAYAIPNGSTNDFLVSKSGVLTLHGFDVVVSQNGNGVYAEEDSSTAQFEPGAISSITVNGWDQGGIEIDQTLQNVPVTVNLNSATEGIGFSSATSNLSNIQGAVSVQGPGSVALDVYDQNGNGPPGSAYTITSSSVQRTNSAPISFANVSGTLDLFGGPSTSIYNVKSTPSGMTTTIHVTGGGTNSVNIGDSSDNLAYISNLNIEGNGSTSVSVDDSGNLLLPFFSSVYQPILTQYTIGAGTLSRSAIEDQISGPATDPPTWVFNSTISYSGLTSLQITGGPLGAYTYQVNSTVGPNGVIIKANSASDVVTVGGSSHNLAAIGTLNVQGDGSTTVSVDDSGNLQLPFFSSIYQPILTQYTIGAGTLSRSAIEDQISGPATDPPTWVFNSTIGYSGLAALNVTGGPIGTYDYKVTDTTNTNSLALNGGAAQSLFELQGTSAGTTTTVTAGTTADTINVGSAANTLDAIQGGISVTGKGGNTTLAVDDQGNPNAENYTVNPTSIQRSIIVGGVYQFNTAAINYSNIGHVAVYVGSDQSGQNEGGLYNTLDVTGSEAGTVTDLYANNNPTSQTLFYAYPYVNAADSSYNPNNQILGPIHFHGGTSHLDEAGYDDFYDRTAQSYTLTAGQIVDNGFAPVTYDGPLYSVGLTTSAVGGSKVNLRSTTSSWTVVVANSQDVVRLGSKAPALGGTLVNIAGNVTIDTAYTSQSAKVVLDDSGDTQMGRQVTFSNDGYAWGISSLTSSRIYFALGSGSSIQVDGGSGNTTFALQGPTPVGISLALVGGSGNNTLQGANATNSWTISGANAGKVGSVSFSHVQNLVGGTGVDDFKFSSTSATVSSLNGGGAPAGQGDWLDYSSLPSTSTVTVNLATGSATNVNGGAAGAVSNIQNVIGSATGTNNLTGSAQGNILIGGSGSNTLTGGSGNSLLIGGSGHGSITGGSGTDILIAGTTTYNATTTAGQDSLMAILAELQSADTFAQKVSDLINGSNSGGGSDLNGKNKLTWGVSGATVKASTGKFTLSGDTSASSNPDWFFSNASSTVTDFNDDGVQDEHNNNAIGAF